MLPPASVETHLLRSGAALGLLGLALGCWKWDRRGFWGKRTALAEPGPCSALLPSEFTLV